MDLDVPIADRLNFRLTKHEFQPRYRNAGAQLFLRKLG
jgi:hypothetical protein